MKYWAFPGARAGSGYIARCPVRTQCARAALATAPRYARLRPKGSLSLTHFIIEINKKMKRAKRNNRSSKFIVC